MRKLLLAGCLLALATPAYAQPTETPIGPPNPGEDVNSYLGRVEQQHQIDRQQDQINEQQQRMDWQDSAPSYAPPAAPAPDPFHEDPFK